MLKEIWEIMALYMGSIREYYYISKNKNFKLNPLTMAQIATNNFRIILKSMDMEDLLSKLIKDKAALTGGTLLRCLNGDRETAADNKYLRDIDIMLEKSKEANIVSKYLLRNLPQVRPIETSGARRSNVLQILCLSTKDIKKLRKRFPNHEDYKHDIYGNIKELEKCIVHTGHDNKNNFELLYFDTSEKSLEDIVKVRFDYSICMNVLRFKPKRNQLYIHSVEDLVNKVIHYNSTYNDECVMLHRIAKYSHLGYKHIFPKKIKSIFGTRLLKKIIKLNKKKLTK